MNVVKCKNGHFFDGDSYAACPHCGEGIAAESSANLEMKKDAGRKRLSWGRKDKTENTSKHPEMQSHPAETNRFFTEPKAASSTPLVTASKDRTLDFWQTKSQPEENKNAIPSALKEEKAEMPTPLPAREPERTSGSETNGRDSSGDGGSLKAAVQKASASSEGKTMSYFSAAAAERENKEAPGPSADPVVGWLVCIKGQHFGESFNIAAGRNSIGRGEENKIVLGRDKKISRTKHALLTYEPKKRNFYLQPGDGSGLTYLNDEYIEESQKIHARDIVEMGDSKFMFIPLCDESFSWEDYIEKE